MWGGDLEALCFKQNLEDFLKIHPLFFMAGEPYLERLTGTISDGTIIGARGKTVFAPESELNTWLRTIYLRKKNLY